MVCNFYIAIDRSWVHQDCSILHTIIALLRQTMEFMIIFLRENRVVVMALMLHTKEHHHVHLVNHFINRYELTIVSKFRTSPLIWTSKEELSAKTFQDLHIRFGYTRVIKVTSDSYLQIIKMTEFLVNCHQVKQTLARMLTRTITTIYDRSCNRWAFD